MSRSCRTVPLALALALSFATSVAAQGDTDDEARGLFLAGQAAFEGGRYEEALEHFERAYELSERPGLLYNIGHTAQRLRRDERAIEAFELFLERDPDSEKRAQVEARLELLREQVAAGDAEEEAAADPGSVDPEPTPPPPPTEEAGPPAAGLALLIAGGAVAVGGAVSLGLAASSKSAVDDAPAGTFWDELEGDVEAFERRRAIGLALLAVGVVGAGVGAVLFAIGGGEDDAEPGMALRVHPLGASMRGTF